MKRILIIAIALFLTVIATSCGEQGDTSETTESAVVIQITSQAVSKQSGDEIKEEKITKATKPNQTTTEPTDATQPSTAAKTKKKKRKTLPTQGDVVPNTYVAVTTEPNGSFDSSDLEFVFEGAFIDLNDDIEDAIAILGDDNAASELSKTKTEYEYEDVTLLAYASGDTERVEKITVTSDRLATTKGAKVGMYGTKLRTVYGIPTHKNETTYIYNYGNKSLVFHIENNIVTSYSYVLNH